MLTIGIGIFALIMGSSIVAPLLGDDPDAGIKISRGSPGPEYDHCRPATEVHEPAFNDPVTV